MGATTSLGAPIRLQWAQARATRSSPESGISVGPGGGPAASEREQAPSRAAQIASSGSSSGSQGRGRAPVVMEEEELGFKERKEER